MDTILVEPQGEGVALLRFNRPELRNALNTPLRHALDAAMRGLVADAAVRCIVIAGAGDHFAAGADIGEQAGRDAVGAIGAYTTRAIAECPKPVIAAVNGFALGGGCEFAMQADFIIASEGARFGQPEINLGLVPGAGGTQRLPRLVGRQNALFMLLTGSFVGAADAHRMGLVAEVVPGDAVPRALELARRVAALPALTAAAIKEAVNAGLDGPLDAGLRLERRLYQLMFATPDMREGVAAFTAKRKPAFNAAVPA